MIIIFEILCVVFIVAATAASSAIIYKARRAWLKAIEKSQAKKEMREIENTAILTERIEVLNDLETKTAATRSLWGDLMNKVTEKDNTSSDPLSIDIRPAIKRIVESYIQYCDDTLTEIVKQRATICRLMKFSAVYVEEYIPDEIDAVAKPAKNILLAELQFVGWSSPDVLKVVDGVVVV